MHLHVENGAYNFIIKVVQDVSVTKPFKRMLF